MPTFTNYTLSFNNSPAATYTISPGNLSLTLAPKTQSATYNGNSFGNGTNNGNSIAQYTDLLANYTVSGLVGKDALPSITKLSQLDGYAAPASGSSNLTFTPSAGGAALASAPVNADTYTIGLGGAVPTFTNYTLSFNNSPAATYTISPGNLSLTLAPKTQSATYNGNSFGNGTNNGNSIAQYTDLLANYTVSGLSPEDASATKLSSLLGYTAPASGSSNLTFTPSAGGAALASAPVNADTYTIGLGGAVPTFTNYTLSFNNSPAATYTISQANLSLTLAPKTQSATYNGNSFGNGTNNGNSIAQYTDLLANYTVSGLWHC